MRVMLSDSTDIQWLRDVHLTQCVALPPFTVAVLEGNEDAPDLITLYEVDHVDSLTMTLTAWPDGSFRCTSSRY